MKRILALFILLACQSFGANHYFRSGASGANNGSSWANAWTSFSGKTFVRGDTYYIAGGTYGFFQFNTTVSGTTYVYFKKANASDNGSDPGWDPTYATTQAVFTLATNGGVLDIARNYFSMDGVTGSKTAPTSMGIKIYSSSTDANSFCVQFESGVGFYELSHLDMQGSGFSASAFSTQGVYCTNATSVKGQWIHDCWIHEVTANGAVLNNSVGTDYTSDYGLLFENNLVSETGGCTDVDIHGQGMQLGVASEFCFTVIRNNYFRNVVGSAMISFLTSGDNANHHDNQIYNNVFFYTDVVTYKGLSPGPIWHEAVKSYSGIVNSRLYMDNNVFYNINGTGSRGSIIIEVITSDVQLKNNVSENCAYTTGNSAGLTQSNNGYYGNTGAGVPSGTTNQVNGSATTFTNAASGDYSLVAGSYAVGSGLDLSSSFTTFADGTTRTVPWNLGTLPVSGSGVSGSGASGKLILSGVAHLY